VKVNERVNAVPLFVPLIVTWYWVLVARGALGRMYPRKLPNRYRVLAGSFAAVTGASNVTGALVMGMLAGYGQSEPGKLLFSETARTFLMIGVLGGYTTFSSFSLQTFLLLEQGNLIGAVLNVLLSVLLCVAGIWAGFAAIRLVV